MEKKISPYWYATLIDREKYFASLAYHNSWWKKRISHWYNTMIDGQECFFSLVCHNGWSIRKKKIVKRLTQHKPVLPNFLKLETKFYIKSSYQNIVYVILIDKLIAHFENGKSYTKSVMSTCIFFESHRQSNKFYIGFLSLIRF